MKTLIPFLLASCLIVSGCGSPTLDEGIRALQSAYDGGSYEMVLKDAPGLLEQAGLDPSGDTASAWKIQKIRLLSLGKLGKGDEAAEVLAGLTPVYPDKIKAQLYAQIGGFVMDTGNYSEAVTVLDAGAKAFVSKKATFDPLIKSCTERAKAAGDNSALDALKSLGYL
jgi:hypothetical protein